MEDNTEKIDPWKNQFASFLKEPTRDNLRNLLQLEAVEDDDLEFKKELIEFDVIAKHILAMANKNGGVIVFGVEETKPNQFSVCGLSKSYDLTDVEKKLGNYIPRELKSKFIPIFFDKEHPEFEGKLFFVVIVQYDPKYLPFVALKPGEKLRNNVIYTRRNRASEPINYDELQEIINNRIETEYSTTDERKLVEHLEELKQLYSHIPKTISRVVSHTPPSLLSSTPLGIGLPKDFVKQMYGETKYEHSSNPDYPEESYENFIKRLIEIKKGVIIKLIKKS